MQSYSTIIGVIELRLGGIGYRTTTARYGIGSSTVTLIMERFKESGLTIDALKAMEEDMQTENNDTVFLYVRRRYKCHNRKE